MPGQSISQIPLQALSVNGGTDFMEVSQATGNPSAPYVTKRVLIGVFAPATSFTKGVFTLDPGVTSTVVPLTGCLPTSSFGGMPWPKTPHAANAFGTTYFIMGTDEFTVIHANNSLVDREFGFVLFY